MQKRRELLAGGKGEWECYKGNHYILMVSIMRSYYSFWLVLRRSIHRGWGSECFWQCPNWNQCDMNSWRREYITISSVTPSQDFNHDRYLLLKLNLRIKFIPVIYGLSFCADVFCFLCWFNNFMPNNNQQMEIYPLCTLRVQNEMPCPIDTERETKRDSYLVVCSSSSRAILSLNSCTYRLKHKRRSYRVNK